MQYKSDVEAVDALVEKYKILKSEVAKVIVGQDEIVKKLIICIFSRGHCLLVGVPGLAKTLMVIRLQRHWGSHTAAFSSLRILCPLILLALRSWMRQENSVS